MKHVVYCCYSLKEELIMNIHDIAALVSLACAIYLIIIGASDLIAEKIGKILTDRLDREQHVSKH